jgi:hypothetical protein
VIPGGENGWSDDRKLRISERRKGGRLHSEGQLRIVLMNVWCLQCVWKLIFLQANATKTNTSIFLYHKSCTNFHYYCTVTPRNIIVSASIYLEEL